MRDEKQRSLEGRQILFQPEDGVDVEMIGWLVEQEKIRLGDQRLPEQCASAPAARQLSNRTVRRQRQARDHQLRLLLETPSITFLELVLQVAQPLERRVMVGDTRRAEPRCGPMVCGSKRAQLAESHRHLLENGARPGELDILIQARDAEGGRAPDAASVQWQISGDGLQQARFSRTVPADQRDPLARLNPKRCVFEQRQMPEGEREAVERD